MKIIELRFIAGLSVEEVAEILNVSSRTVKCDSMMARAADHKNPNEASPQTDEM